MDPVSATQNVEFDTLSEEPSPGTNNYVDPSIWGRLISLSPSGTHIELKNDVYVIGRSSSCDIQFKDGRISGTHCRIYRQKAGEAENDHWTVFVHDKSTNGTFVNRKLIGKNKKTTISHQDRISLITSAARDPIEFIFHDLSTLQEQKNSKVSSPIDEEYDLKNKLGAGNFGVVYRAVKKATGEQFAIKIVDKTRFTIASSRPEALQDEVNILRKVDHKGIVKLYDVKETKTHLYLVLEKIDGGELFDRIVSRKKYSEQQSRELMKNLLDALQYLHSMGIAHRDLKPENILLASTTNDVDIRLTDFGVSRIIGEDGLFRTLVGTPHYLAPEVIKNSQGGIARGYGPGCDIWSSGVILYILLSGSPPFYEKRNIDILDQVVKGLYDFPDKLFQFISPCAKDMVKRMLTVDPNLRFTIDECFEHPWMKGNSLTTSFLDMMDQRHRKILSRVAQGLPAHPEPSESKPPASSHEPETSEQSSSQNSQKSTRTRGRSKTPKGSPGPPPSTLRSPMSRRRNRSSQSEKEEPARTRRRRQ